MQTFEVREKKVNEKETRTSKQKRRKGGVHDTSQMVKEESILRSMVQSTLSRAGKELRKMTIEKCSFHSDMEVTRDYTLLFSRISVVVVLLFSLQINGSLSLTIDKPIALQINELTKIFSKKKVLKENVGGR